MHKCSIAHASTNSIAENELHLSSLSREDIGITGIQDSHNTASEELSASGTELNLYIIVSK